MKRLVLFLALVAFLASTAWGETLTILHLNDTHAHLLPYGPKDATGTGAWGGMARIATLVGMNKMTEPNVMLFHAGDFSVGDFMFQEYLGIPELGIMKQLGFDAVELGNHEFDLYSSTLKYELVQAGFPTNGFPVLAANLDYSADPEMGYFVQPYIIKQYGAVKVGVFGLLTDFTNSGSNPSPNSVIPPLNVAQAWIDSLKIGHGCDIVILLSHLGYEMDQMVASYTAGIDVIVGGHSHTTLTQPVKVGGSLILQAGEFGHYLGKMHLVVDNGVLNSFDYSLIPVDANIPEEPTIKGLLSNLVAGIEADPRFGPVYSSPVAQVKTTLDKDFGHNLVMDNPMGNLVSDAFRKSTGTDIAFQPQGFINQPIWAGSIVGNDIFQAVPYGFDQASGLGLKLATFKTDGMSIIAGLEFAAYNLPYLEDFFLHASNLSFAYNSANQPGSRVDYASIKIAGKPLNPAGQYTVTVPDGVIPFLQQIPNFNIGDLVITDKFMYTVVKDYLHARTPVVYYREGRILDLAVMADPIAGGKALAAMIPMYQANGAIRRPITANILERQFQCVVKLLENHRTILALIELCAIRHQLDGLARGGQISVSAASTLKYVIANLIGSIKQANGIAWKEDAEQEETSLLPATYSLAQNYPNPFNPTTRIEFSLPTTSDVSLDIYNVLGQRVKSLIDGSMTAGDHSVEWNGTDGSGQKVASGVYFYRLKAGDFTETKKMMMLK